MDFGGKINWFFLNNRYARSSGQTTLQNDTSAPSIVYKQYFLDIAKNQNKLGECKQTWPWPGRF
jgi:hypothetical protein